MNRMKQYCWLYLKSLSRRCGSFPAEPTFTRPRSTTTARTSLGSPFDIFLGPTSSVEFLSEQYEGWGEEHFSHFQAAEPPEGPSYAESQFSRAPGSCSVILARSIRKFHWNAMRLPSGLLPSEEVRRCDSSSEFSRATTQRGESRRKKFHRRCRCSLSCR
jgi:hypothetical protein